jgi:hypothetical protein
MATRVEGTALARENPGEVSMKTIPASAIVALLVGPGSVLAQAATPTPPATGAPAPGGSSALVTALVLLAVVVVMIAALAKFLDLKRKRESEAVQLQAQIADAMLRDSRFFGLPITPTAHVGWRGTPATVELSGQVPSQELHDAALQLARDEARRIRPDVAIEDRLMVTPMGGVRAA